MPFLAGIVLIGLVCVIYGPQFTARPTQQLANSAYRVDLNTADRSALMQVPGIGPSRADAILAKRAEVGSFQSVDDVNAVKGFGTKTLDGIRSFVIVEGDPKPSPTPGQTPAPAGKLKVGDPPLAINSCPESELLRLPAIGPTLAARIVAARPFATIDDLRKVKGIGAKTLESLRPFVKVDP